MSICIVTARPLRKNSTARSFINLSVISMLAFAMRVSAPGSNNALSESQGQINSISSRLMARADVGVYLEFAKGKKNYNNFFRYL